MEDEQSHENPDGEILGEKAGLNVINTVITIMLMPLIEFLWFAGNV